MDKSYSKGQYTRYSQHSCYCAKHFPSGFPVIKGKGEKTISKESPSIFQNIPKRLLPTRAAYNDQQQSLQFCQEAFRKMLSYKSF